MENSQNTQHEIENVQQEADVEVVEENKAESTNNNIFNQQNNFHLVQNIDLDKLSCLFEKSPDIANRVMDLYEKQQQHNVSIDQRILAIEEKEQKARHDERPYQRKFAFKSLNFAMLLSTLSLIAAGFFAYLKYPYLAGTAITIPIGVGVANMLGRKSIKQTESDKKKEDD